MTSRGSRDREAEAQSGLGQVKRGQLEVHLLKRCCGIQYLIDQGMREREDSSLALVSHTNDNGTIHREKKAKKRIMIQREENVRN